VASCSSFRGVVLEDCARSVYSGGQHRGKEGGGLVEDSSLRCQRRRKMVRRRALAWRLEGLASASIGPRSWRRSPWEVGTSRFELPR
jgi:hypothetical protein